VSRRSALSVRAARLSVAAAAAALTVTSPGMAADTAASSVPAQTTVSFIACPVYRDTNNGRKSGCWLATDMTSGIRYDVSAGRSKPQIGRDVLVEGTFAAGTLAAATDACGGQVLAPVHVSVLPTACSSVMLPAEGFPGRVFQVPKDGYLPPADVV